MNSYLVSIDVAQSYDSTVIVIFEKCIDFQKDGRAVSYMIARDLKMIQQVKYGDLAKYIYKLSQHADLHGNADFVIDSTGVGVALCDYIDAEGVETQRIVYTGGNGESARETQRKTSSGFTSDRKYCVPKEELITSLKIGLEQRRVRVAKGIPYEADIKKQFSHFIGMLSRTKRMIYGNDQDSIHDDIVCAFAQAAWFYLRKEGALTDYEYSPEKRFQPVTMKRINNTETTDYNFSQTL